MQITTSSLLALFLTSVPLVICQNAQDVIKSVVSDVNTNDLHRLINFLGRERRVKPARPIAIDTTMLDKTEHDLTQDIVKSHAGKSDIGSLHHTDHVIQTRPNSMTLGPEPESIPSNPTFSRVIGSANQIFASQTLPRTGIAKQEQTLRNPKDISDEPMHVVGKSSMTSVRTVGPKRPIKPLTEKLANTAVYQTRHMLPFPNSGSQQSRHFPPQHSFRTLPFWNRLRLRRVFVRGIKRVPCKLTYFNVRCFYDIPVIRVFLVPL
ncbi:uncharacterized protein LOC128227611 [Mya arenaria]|uniref:uncharacterized protein LOC128227611 n=1 Tax=Mya arenaria TaxID=6604 RepID=UPI0022E06FE3|nr:uncharacterized protein LOC128227611 [Mya arenaria]